MAVRSQGSCGSLILIMYMYKKSYMYLHSTRAMGKNIHSTATINAKSSGPQFELEIKNMPQELTIVHTQ